MKASLALVLLSVLSVFAAHEANRPFRPHIVFFVIDDVGYNDVGFSNNSGMVTPFLDSFVKEGLNLNQYYTQPVCSPARSALLQGRYPFATGMQHFSTLHPCGEAGMVKTSPTAAELFRDAGYNTYHIGKWHLGYSRWDQTPTSRGFHSHVGYLQGMEDYFNKSFAVPAHYLPFNIHGYDWWRNKTVAWEDDNKYNLNLYDEEVERILKLYTSDETVAKSPLFMYMAHQIVHIPLEAPSEYKEKCSHIQDPSRKTYCGMMNALDGSMQRFVEGFKKAGLWDDTLMIVTTDNGGIPNYGEFPNSAGSNYPLRAGKGTCFEGGVRSVGFLQGGENVFPKSKRGSSSDALMHITDWLATVLPMVNSTAKPTLDGFDMWDVLINNATNQRTNIPLNINKKIQIPNAGHQIAIRSGDWKLISQQITGETLNYDGWYPPPPAKPIPAPENKDGFYLFNLKDDPNEHNNLYSSRPDIVAELNKVLESYMDIYQDSQTQNFDIFGLPGFHNGTWSPWKGNTTSGGFADDVEKFAVHFAAETVGSWINEAYDISTGQDHDRPEDDAQIEYVQLKVDNDGKK